MYKRLILLAGLFLVFRSGFSQSRKYVIAVIGSSTAQGVGATPIDSSWVNRTRFYYDSLGELDTIYNIALGGQTTYDGMPSNFVPPAGRPLPDTTRNITKALSFNPDVVLVNFPSNDAAADYSLTETMANLRVMYQTVIAAGKIAYVTTSEPRTSLATVQKQLLKTMRDSVKAEFGTHSLDFYDALVGPDSLDINPIYNFDGTHPNNAGHLQLFLVVKKAEVLPEPTPPVTPPPDTTPVTPPPPPPPIAPTLKYFSATPAGETVLLAWDLTGGSGPTTIEVERSTDSVNFTDLDQQTAGAAPAADSSSFVDAQPLTGKNFYRLRYGNDTAWKYSPLVTVDMASAVWGIGKLAVVRGAEELQAEISTPAATTATVSVFNASGELVLRQVVALSPPKVTITIPTAGWIAGEYFLRVVTNLGNRGTKAFIKF